MYIIWTQIKYKSYVWWIFDFCRIERFQYTSSDVNHSSLQDTARLFTPHTLGSSHNCVQTVHLIEIELGRWTQYWVPQTNFDNASLNSNDFLASNVFISFSAFADKLRIRFTSDLSDKLIMGLPMPDLLMIRRRWIPLVSMPHICRSVYSHLQKNTLIRLSPRWYILGLSGLLLWIPVYT